MEEEDMNIDDVLSDSEDDYDENEKRLLEKVRKGRRSDNFDSEDEVLGFDEDGDDAEKRDSMESDIEGLEEDFDLPDEKAWGAKNKDYYWTDYVDPNYSTIDQKAQERALEEEKEARRIQKRLAEQLDDADFGLDIVEAESTKDAKDEEEIVKTDLTKLSQRQKLQLLEKENPELVALIDDLQSRLAEMKNILEPFLKLVDEGKCPKCLAVSFVETKYQLLLYYCVNLSFYLTMKAKRLAVNSHPVIKRLSQYRQLLSQLEAAQGQLLDEISEILEAAKDDLPLYSISNESLIMEQKVKVVESKEKETGSDEEFGGEMEADEDAETTEAEKRAITYEMAKNKGLTPYRKKELRNPRVKHRMKYRKAKIRRKGAVREVRKETSRYAGEISGIKASVKKGIKLK